MKKSKYYVSLSSDESRIILLSLIRMKNKLSRAAILIAWMS